MAWVPWIKNGNNLIDPAQPVTRELDQNRVDDLPPPPHRIFRRPLLITWNFHVIYLIINSNLTLAPI